MFLIALQLDHARKCLNKVWGWGYMKEDLVFWQGVVFMQNFWNFKAIPDTKIILTSIQSKLILKRFKWFLWRGFQKWWKLFVLIFGEKYEVTFGWSQKVEISIWGLMRTVFRRKCEEHEVTSGWSQKVEISIWGFLRTVFKAFILFAWIMILFRMKKHCLPIQIARLWSERAWLGT